MHMTVMCVCVSVCADAILVERSHGPQRFWPIPPQEEEEEEREEGAKGQKSEEEIMSQSTRTPCYLE